MKCTSHPKSRERDTIEIIEILNNIFIYYVCLNWFIQNFFDRLNLRPQFCAMMFNCLLIIYAKLLTDERLLRMVDCQKVLTL